MTILRVIKNSENKLMRGRIVEDKDLIPRFQVRSLAKGSKWADADIKEYRVTRARTILCKTVNHSLGCKKTFKTGKRYQIESGRVAGGVAGIIFDEDGDAWTLYREDVGFSTASATFEAKYF
ncbi:hypothetical protein [Gibbsiella quercinecans]|uniref:hypothetical protein n=1 Tax=Gibbsiella quercinecans TaxID=929813 RepID=UPI0024329F3B|nr:hypothetical protein [Gibbsiella quercinecans]